MEVYVIKNSNGEYYYYDCYNEIGGFCSLLKSAYFFLSDWLAYEHIKCQNLQNCKVVKIEMKEVEGETK